ICMAGMYLNVTEEKCFKCPYNFYQNETLQESCHPCPKDYQTQTDGAVSIDNCTCDCGPGTYFDNTTVECVPCEKGYYQNQSLQKECLMCPVNTSTRNTGTTTEDDCTKYCKPGQFVGDNSCEPCAKGSYSTFPISKTCIACPEGQSTKETGADSVNLCD
ncbi:unnamed protein product, partial [Candidula unifasciata]